MAGKKKVKSGRLYTPNEIIDYFRKHGKMPPEIRKKTGK